MTRRRYVRSELASVFRPITADQLLPNAVAASCLDDQYIDRETLLSKGTAFRQRYTACVLDEFAKCLLSAEQVVVNRTYLQNTEVMEHLAPATPDADDTAIIRLFDDGAIVPYLYSDDDPTLKASVESGAINRDAASAWNRVCERTEPRCLRLSWDETEDASLRSERLASHFANRLEAVASEGSPEILRELSNHHPVAAMEAFGRYLRNDLLPLVRDRPTRRQLYERLVVRDGSNVVDTAIDLQKPFAVEVKQLIDLVYNANMAGALGLNNVVPSRSISASLLADSGLQPVGCRSVSPDLAAAVANMAIRIQRDHYDSSSVPILGTLSMDAVAAIRDGSVWRRYVRAVSDVRDIDPSLDEGTFIKAIEEAIGLALDRSDALCRYLYSRHGAERQRRIRVRSLIAQAGSLCLGAAIGTVMPETPAGPFVGNLLGGALQLIAEKPLRYLAMQVDPLGGTFAAWRLPDLKLDGHERTMKRFHSELKLMGIGVGAIEASALPSPQIEAELSS